MGSLFGAHCRQYSLLASVLGRTARWTHVVGDRCSFVQEPFIVSWWVAPLLRMHGHLNSSPTLHLSSLCVCVFEGVARVECR